MRSRRAVPFPAELIRSNRTHSNSIRNKASNLHRRTVNSRMRKARANRCPARRNNMARQDTQAVILSSRIKVSLLRARFRKRRIKVISIPLRLTAHRNSSSLHIRERRSFRTPRHIKVATAHRNLLIRSSNILNKACPARECLATGNNRLRLLRRNTANPHTASRRIRNNHRRSRRRCAARRSKCLGNRCRANNYQDSSSPLRRNTPVLPVVRCRRCLVRRKARRRRAHLRNRRRDREPLKLLGPVGRPPLPACRRRPQRAAHRNPPHRSRRRLPLRRRTRHRPESRTRAHQRPERLPHQHARHRLRHLQQRHLHLPPQPHRPRLRPLAPSLFQLPRHVLRNRPRSVLPLPKYRASRARPVSQRRLARPKPRPASAFAKHHRTPTTRLSIRSRC